MSSQKLRFTMVDNPNRHTFSSRCSKSQHRMCNGHVNKRRCSDGICRCDCHEVVE